jgi:hypothetical protein
MPAIVGVIERLHQPLYDTLCRGIVTATVNIGPGGQAVTGQTRLFSGQNLGNRAWTNMKIAGQLVADRTFKVKALRVLTEFRAGLLTNGIVGSPSYYVHRLYLSCQMQLFWTVSIGDKPQFVCGTHYLPMAAGIWGDVGGDTTLVVMNNGHPGHESLLRLGRPIEVLAEIFQMNAAADHDLVQQINTVDDISKDVKFFLDGLGTREVQ